MSSSEEGLEGTLMQVADFQHPCRDDATGSMVLCLRVRYEGEDAWTDLQDTIENFSPQWGWRALLDVEITDEAGAPHYLKLSTIETEDMAGDAGRHPVRFATMKESLIERWRAGLDLRDALPESERHKRAELTREQRERLGQLPYVR